MPTITLSLTDQDFERMAAAAHRGGFDDVQSMFQVFVEEASGDDLDRSEIPSSHLKLLLDGVESAERGELIPANEAFEMARANLQSL
jgi:hypothetical protein